MLVRNPQANRHTRLCHLVAAMFMEEACPQKRGVPSSWSLLKAEYGYIGNRQQVLEQAQLDAQEGKFRA